MRGRSSLLTRARPSCGEPNWTRVQASACTPRGSTLLSKCSSTSASAGPTKRC
ncbi:unnamed protein product [Ectocarpus fasciculatus]